MVFAVFFAKVLLSVVSLNFVCAEVRSCFVLETGNAQFVRMLILAPLTIAGALWLWGVR